MEWNGVDIEMCGDEVVHTGFGGCEANLVT